MPFWKKKRQIESSIDENEQLFTYYSALARSKGGEEQAKAMKAFSKLKDKRALPLIRQVFQESQHERAKGEAAQALGKLKDSSSISQLLAHLNHPSAFVRESIVVALGFLAKDLNKEAVDQLVDLFLHDPVGKVRATAALTLSKCEDSRLCSILLSQLTTDEEDLVRLNCVSALVELGCSSSISVLKTILGKDPDSSVRDNCAWALGMFRATEAVEELLDALFEDEDEGVRKNAAWAIRKLGISHVIDELQDALASETSPFVKEEIAKTINHLQPQQNSTRLESSSRRM